jgi:septal ring factor EnvC (AmiA/AmiB activator)
MKYGAWALAVIGFVLFSGCSTGRSYQPDIDSLNSRVSALQSEVSSKDQEIARLQDQLNRQESALSQSESDKRMMNERLDSTLAQLEAEKARKAEMASRPAQSDLK